MNEKTDMHIFEWRECARRFFHSYLKNFMLLLIYNLRFSNWEFLISNLGGGGILFGIGNGALFRPQIKQKRNTEAH